MTRASASAAPFHQFIWHDLFRCTRRDSSCKSKWINPSSNIDVAIVLVGSCPFRFRPNFLWLISVYHLQENFAAAYVAPSGNQTWLEHLPLVDSPSYKFPFQSRHVPATFDYGMVFRWSSSVSSVLPPRHTSPCLCFGRWSQLLDDELGGTVADGGGAFFFPKQCGHTDGFLR